jgi:hypothetical protein
MSNNNPAAPGKLRFEYFLVQVQSILDKANAAENPALVCYEANMRTPFFMLQGLSRLYEKMHNSKSFGKMRKQFKIVEDKLGVIDYYDAFHKDFSTTPEAIINYFQIQKEKHLSELNQLLKKKAWTGVGNKRINKINFKLKKADWLPEAEDTEAIVKRYRKDIAGIVKDIRNNKINFDNVEQDVHELRREIRWLSIYAQALRGLVQLKSNEVVPDGLQPYQTPEVLNSPFNKMPEAGAHTTRILADAPNFYTLSWLISELGMLKDYGLRIMAVKEAIMATPGKSNEKQATEEAMKLIGEGQLSIQEVLARAKQISDEFFSNKVLEGLLVEEEKGA